MTAFLSRQTGAPSRRLSPRRTTRPPPTDRGSHGDCWLAGRSFLRSSFCCGNSLAMSAKRLEVPALPLSHEEAYAGRSCVRCDAPPRQNHRHVPRCDYANLGREPRKNWVTQPTHSRIAALVGRTRLPGRKEEEEKLVLLRAVGTAAAAAAVVAHSAALAGDRPRVCTCNREQRDGAPRLIQQRLVLQQLRWHLRACAWRCFIAGSAGSRHRR